MLIQKLFRRIFRIAIQIVRGPFWFSRDLFLYLRALYSSGTKAHFYIVPYLFDREASSHTFDKHYVYMDRWAFQGVLKSAPKTHVDVGSSIRFLSMATTVAAVTYVDIRPVKLDFENFTCTKGSVLDLPFPDNSISSLSCLHVAEHIGLGRYGDPLDVEGTRKACKELMRVLAPGGTLYFALPIGKSATYFNAHRVHSPRAILEYFNELSLDEFAVVTDQGAFRTDENPHAFETSIYACGCFKLSKPIT